MGPKEKTVKQEPKYESIQDNIWDKTLNCIIKTEWDTTKTVLDPRYETIKWDPEQKTMNWDPKYGPIENNRWDPKQLLHNEKLVYIT